MPRLFIAIPVDPAPPALVAVLQPLVDAAGRSVLVHGRSYRLKTVAPENLHATLAFLGDVSDGRAEQLPRLLDASVGAAGVAPFDAALGPPSLLPPGSRRPARVLYAPVVPPEPVIRLAGEVTHLLAAAGFDVDRRPYRPHVTLARLAAARRDAPGPLASLEAVAPDLKSLGTTFRVEAIHLVQSRLTSRGPVYTPVHRSLLPG